MATQATGGGSTVSFGKAPQANNDTFSFTADAGNSLIRNVFANDLGGACAIGSSLMAGRCKREIAFIDRGVDDLEMLLAGMRPDVDAIVLSNEEPALGQMARVLKGRGGLQAIHIIAHGKPGEVSFTGGTLTKEGVQASGRDLAQIGLTLAPDGQIALWACHVASEEAQTGDLVTSLAAACGARVAATSGKVGHASKGGIWHLDSAAPSPVTDRAMHAYQGVLDNGNGTTVDNLNVLDAIKTNDTNGVEYIYWSDISTFLATSTNATQTVTIQQAFQAGQLLLTFQVGSNYYTIGYNSAASVYYQSSLATGFFLEQTDQYGTPVGQLDAITGQTVSGSPLALISGFTGAIPNFISQINNLGLFASTAQLITDTIDGGTGKDNIQGIASNAAIHNIIQGGAGADVLTGGIGSDYFVFARATDSPAAGQLNSGGQLAQTWDQITNFQVGSDKLDFSQLLSDQSVSSAGGVTAFAAGLAEFRWFGAQPANTTSMGSTNGYGVWYTPDGSGGSYVYADTNGDGVADLKFDVAGVTALNPSDFLAVDPPSAFTVHINPIEPTQSNSWLINLADANAGVTVTGTVTHFTPNAQLIVTLNGHNYTATVAANGTWSAVIPANDLAHNLLPDGSYTLSATVKVGSSTAASDSHSVTVDETPPTIAISTISGDNRLNLAESASNMTISGTTTGVENGQTVSVVLHGHTYTGTVSNNAWSVTAPAADLAHAQLPDGSYSVTANVSDLAGNPATQATHTLTVDETPPTIAISTISGDDRLNLAESASNLTISGTTTGVENGQTVSVVLHGHTYTGTASNNAWSVTAPAADLAHAQLPDGSYQVTANVSDQAGNPATQATHSLTVDETPPTITIDTISGDDRLNLAESASNLTISGTTTGVENGQTVSVVLHGHTYTGTVSNNAWSVTAPAADLAHAQLPDGSYQVTANVSDQAGNPATQASKTLIVDETPPTIAISTISGDDRLNLAESASNLTIGGTTTGVENGQTVSVVLHGHTYTGTVSNNAWSVTAPAADLAHAQLPDGSYQVTANVS
ncbi:Ig-like domain-containing protein, partial [Bradyrhizobium sp. CCBAU 45384]|uniref:Ig-like domain-containing protein n=1 Tax=Bradyrhizobium sp. CCBAU 45384 TaxID=858428 RepID=UPI0023057E6C